MSEHQKRILFLCAQRSVRARIAASLLAARARALWDICYTPATILQDEQECAYQILDEIGIPLLPTSQETEPSFGLTWNEGIILCSSSAST